MNPEPQPATPFDLSRLFVFESGWKVALKEGSERVFCHAMAPGQNYYHRLLDGELYLVHADEKLCFACAARRSLLCHEPRGLREPLIPLDDDERPARPGPVIEAGRGFEVLGGSEDEDEEE